jgi:thiamine biosynthesis protein ThiS
VSRPAEGGIELTVNGRSRLVPRAATVAELLAALACDERTVAVERNGALVGRADYPVTRLEAGDRLEIVRFVQGG